MQCSVIMPVLDEAARVGAQLDRLSQQPVHEVIVVDGGSTDETVSIAQRYGVRVLTACRGRAQQMNAGAALASGEVLLFLHADVELPDNALDAIDDAMVDPRVVGGAFKTHTVADRRSPIWAGLMRIADVRSRYTRVPYGDQAVFVRASVFAGLGGFAPLALMEDIEFAHRLRQAGHIERLDAEVQVSGRRFLHRPLYYAALMNILPPLYYAGVPTRVLARLYGAPR